jgi:hypothetical protein
MAECRVVFPAMCGLTVVSRSSMTKFAASKCSLAASVMARVCLQGSQSYRAQPAVRHGQSRHQPRAVAVGAWLMQQSLASGNFAIEHGVGITGRGMGLVVSRRGANNPQQSWGFERGTAIGGYRGFKDFGTRDGTS